MSPADATTPDGPDPDLRRQAIALADNAGSQQAALEQAYDSGWHDRNAAIAALYDRVKDLEGGDGDSLSGGDVIQVLNDWFNQVGLDPDKRLVFIDVMGRECPDAPGATLTPELLRKLPTIAENSDLTGWWAALGVGTKSGMWLHIGTDGGPGGGVVASRRAYVTEDEHDEIVNAIDAPWMPSTTYN